MLEWTLLQQPSTHRKVQILCLVEFCDLTSVDMIFMQLLTYRYANFALRFNRTTTVDRVKPRAGCPPLPNYCFSWEAQRLCLIKFCDICARDICVHDICVCPICVADGCAFDIHVYVPVCEVLVFVVDIWFMISGKLYLCVCVSLHAALFVMTSVTHDADSVIFCHYLRYSAP